MSTATLLPNPILTALNGYSTDSGNLHMESCADVFLYTHPEKPGLILKTRNTGVRPEESDLRAEATAMSWLQGKLPVPEVVCFYEEGAAQYLIMTLLAGVTGIHQKVVEDPANLVREFAIGLRQIHAIDPASCPLDWRMSRYFPWAEDLIASGVFDDRIPAGKTREILTDELAEMKADMPGEEDPVFTHGDYCLPNVMLQEGRLTGFIDWGYAGIGDRYLDFVAARGTIRRNLSEEWVPVFFEAYGFEELDNSKLDAYQKVIDFAFS